MFNTALAARPPINVGALLITVFASILEVFVLCLAGYILAWKGILDKKTQKQLNRINVSLFTPCLLFSKVAFFLSPEKLRELWVIPIFFVIVTTLSMLVAWFLGVSARLSRSQRSFAIAASMFMNSNSLPVALMQSLVFTVNGLKWTSDDNTNAMLGRALTYLVLYSTFGMILRWSYGVRLLAQADDPIDSPIRLPDDEDETSQRRIRDLEQAVRTSTSTATMVDPTATEYRPKTPPSIVIDDSHTQHSSAPSSDDGEREANLRAPPAPFRHPHRKNSYFYRSFPNSPNQSRVSLGEGALVYNDDEEEEDGARNAETFTRPPPRRQSTLQHHHSVEVYEPPSALQRYLVQPLIKFWNGFTEFMTVPLYAAALSIIVAMLPAMQHALEVHLYPVKGALESSGSCSIPVTLVVLGAYFYKESDASNEVVPTRIESAQQAGVVPNGSREPSALEHARGLLSKLNPNRRRPAPLSEPGLETFPGETKTVIISVMSRMVLTPMILMPLIAFAAKEDWHNVFEDPVFVVSNVLLVASPPALTLAQITQAASGDAFERLISRTIFWSYCVATPPLMIFYVVVGLIFAGF
ncbi:hypothetical protein D9757_004198 [Collybiopsis confluens]|uniref:Uncharacterized protein n=1 Tax=Collybiopsis confluens TaxID=2823264 RepID=A0A8H5HU80_9AGAR|nr:hypothetical protein D9757_004198 [Collybiopsis confluens]